MNVTDSGDVDLNADSTTPEPNKAKTGRLGAVKKVLIDWCEITTAHGFVNLVQDIKIWRKVVWAVLILSVIGYIIFSK